MVFVARPVVYPTPGSPSAGSGHASRTSCVPETGVVSAQNDGAGVAEAGVGDLHAHGLRPATFVILSREGG